MTGRSLAEQNALERRYDGPIPADATVTILTPEQERQRWQEAAEYDLARAAELDAKAVACAVMGDLKGASICRAAAHRSRLNAADYQAMADAIATRLNDTMHAVAAKRAAE